MHEAWTQAPRHSPHLKKPEGLPHAPRGMKGEGKLRQGRKRTGTQGVHTHTQACQGKTGPRGSLQVAVTHFTGSAGTPHSLPLNLARGLLRLQAE